MLRKLIIIIASTLVTSGVAAPVSVSEPIDFVFSLENTLVRGTGLKASQRSRPVNGAPEFIASLLQMPGARISFFSTSDKADTLKILKEFRLPDGRSALEITHRILTPEKSIEGGKKNDLRKVIEPGGRMDRVVLFDSDLRSAPIGQDKNLLWTGDDIAFQANDNLARNKLARARGILEMAFELSTELRLPLTEALYRVQWFKDFRPEGGHHFRRETLTDPIIYQRGARAFRKTNSGYRFTPALEQQAPNSCLRQQLKHGLFSASP